VSYSKFTVPRVEREFGLTTGVADLFAGVPPVEPSAVLTDGLAANVELALRQETEKARSELIIAPVLAEVWRRADRRLAVFSGVLLDVDEARSLNGVCDFLITDSPPVVPVRAPILAVVESKRYELSSGYGQCAAALVAAPELNRRKGTGRDAVYGACTTGTEWQFLRLAAARLTLDARVYVLADLPRILGILLAVCGFGPAPLHPRPDAP
jgi:hypothetical protein